MRLSENILSIKPLPIALFSEKAVNTPGCVRLDLGEPDFDTPRHIKRAAEVALDKNITHYAPTTGFPELRDEVAKTESVKCSGLTRDNVIITTGGEGALFCAAASILDSGQEIILENPAWETYSYMTTIAGGRPVHVRFFEGEKLKTENILEKINSRTRAIIINTPQNPTGRVWTRNEVKAMSEIAADHNLFIISDEVYEKIIYGRKHVSFAEFDPDLSHTIIVNSFSKTYAMTGWRIGYGVTNKDYISSLMKVNRVTTTCPSSIAQMAALAALRGSQNSVKKMAAEYKRRRDYILKKLDGLGLSLPKPDGAFYVFPDVSEYDKDSMRFATNAIEKGGFSCIPGVGFGSEGEGHIRFAYCTSIENIVKGMDRFGALLKSYPKRTKN